MIFPSYPGKWAKWWSVEVRFARPLTRREVHRFRLALGDAVAGGYIGTDGATWWKWWNKWPGEGDERLLREAIGRIRVPARIRAAPLGRDCGDGEVCVRSDVTRKMCGHSPEWVEEDWTHVEGQSP